MAEAKKTTATKKSTAKAAAPKAESVDKPEAVKASAGSNDIEQNKAFAVLAYLGILVLVPLLAAPESPFAQFHAKQGLNLWVIYLIVACPLFIISMVPLVGILAWLGLMGLGCAALVFSILGIINAVNGKSEKLPVIGDFQLIK